MNTSGGKTQAGTWWQATLSLTLLLFHGVVAFTILVVMLVITLSK